MSYSHALTDVILQEHAHTFSPWLRWMHRWKRAYRAANVIKPRFKIRGLPELLSPGRKGARQMLLPRNAPISSGEQCDSPTYPV